MNIPLRVQRTRPGAAAAADLLHDAQASLEQLFPGTPAVVSIGERRLLADLQAGRSNDVRAVHR